MLTNVGSGGGAAAPAVGGAAPAAGGDAAAPKAEEKKEEKEESDDDMGFGLFDCKSSFKVVEFVKHFTYHEFLFAETRHEIPFDNRLGSH